MPRRLAPAFLGLALLILSSGTALAQVPYGNNTIPARRSLARINLDLQFFTVVPLEGAEKLSELSIDEGLMFAQTNHANFYAFDAESGGFLWATHLGDRTANSQPAVVNSTSVFVTNSNEIFCLDRRTGRVVWKKELGSQPSSSTGADEQRVMIGLESGKLVNFDSKTGLEKWNIQTNSRVSSHPLLAEKVVAFGSEDRKLYVSRIDKPTLLWRFATGGPIVAPLGHHGVRTLLVASSDKSVYSVDLYSGKSNWIAPTGAPVTQEPLVSGDDVYIVNTEGEMSAIDALKGDVKWTISTLGGRLLAVSGSKVYLESHDDDLFVVDRATGKIVHDPATTYQRLGINLRDFVLGPTNRYDDRLYFATTHGLVICLREIGQVKPRTNRDPNEKAFGYIPPQGYPDPAVPTPTAVPTTPVEGTGETPTDPK
jgi:outer membrane protein assembly factor BamB